MSLSIVLPAKNEGAALADLLPRLKAAQPDAEIIVVDDGSTDDTAALCAEHGVTVLSSPYSMGNGAAIKRGARVATGEVIVFMDADGQHDPALIATLLEKLAKGYDMVVGARSADGQANFDRGVANTFYNWLASRMTGFRREGPHLRLPRRARRQVPRVPAPAAERILVPDHEHDGVLP